MRSPAMPGTGRPAGGLAWACVLGALAGLLHARGAPWVDAWMAMALVGAGLGIALALRTGDAADCWTVLSTALLIALCARFQAGWALSRDESLWQRCSFALAVLAVGARLCITRSAPPAPADPPWRDDAGGSQVDVDAAEPPVPAHGGCEPAGVPAVEQEAQQPLPPAPGRRRIVVLW